MRLFLSLSIISLIFSTVLIAQESDTKEKPLPESGRLAGSSVSGYGHTGFEGAWGGENLSGENASPVSAAIRRLSKQEWVVSVFNNSEDEYQLQLVVEQMNDGSKKLKSNPISVTLKAGETLERQIRAHVLATHATVNLTRWSRIEKELTRDELVTLIEEKKAELAALEAKLASFGG